MIISFVLFIGKDKQKSLNHQIFYLKTVVEAYFLQNGQKKRELFGGFEEKRYFCQQNLKLSKYVRRKRDIKEE